MTDELDPEGVEAAARELVGSRADPFGLALDEGESIHLARAAITAYLQAAPLREDGLTERLRDDVIDAVSDEEVWLRSHASPYGSGFGTEIVAALDKLRATTQDSLRQDRTVCTCATTPHTDRCNVVLNAPDQPLRTTQDSRDD